MRYVRQKFRRVAALGVVAALAAAGLAAHSQTAPAAKPAPTLKFLQPSDLDPAIILPPPPRDDAPAAVAGTDLSR